ncbi:MAG: helix-turn-helix transcriptional regulator [Bacteroidales bacterium]|nr:helix-turn-helix transcriptional regulator [Bacteroidales bacterium]
MIQEQLRKNVVKLLQDRNLHNRDLADALDIDPGQVSRILNGKAMFTLAHIEKISRAFDLRPIDIFTYPDIYIKADGTDKGPAEVLLQLRLTQEKKDQVLKLVFGDNNIEIFNK